MTMIQQAVDYQRLICGILFGTGVLYLFFHHFIDFRNLLPKMSYPQAMFIRSQVCIGWMIVIFSSAIFFDSYFVMHAGVELKDAYRTASDKDKMKVHSMLDFVRTLESSERLRYYQAYLSPNLQKGYFDRYDLYKLEHVMDFLVSTDLVESRNLYKEFTEYLESTGAKITVSKEGRHSIETE